MSQSVASVSTRDQPHRPWMAKVVAMVALLAFCVSPSFAQSGAQGGVDGRDTPVRVIKATPLIFDAPSQPNADEKSEQVQQTSQEASEASLKEKPAPEPTGHGPAVKVESAYKSPSHRFNARDRVSLDGRDRRDGLFGDAPSDRGESAGFSGDDDSIARFDDSQPAVSLAFMTEDLTVDSDEASPVYMDWADKDMALLEAEQGRNDQGVIVYRYDTPRSNDQRVTWFDGDRVRTARPVYGQRTSAEDDNPHAYTAGGYSRHGLEPTRFTGRGQTPVIIIRDRDDHHGHGKACSHGRYSNCSHGCHGGGHGHGGDGHHGDHGDVFCQHHRRFCPSSCTFIRSYSAVGFSHHPRVYTYSVSGGYTSGFFTTTRYVPHASHYRPVVCQPVYRRPVSGTRIGISIGF